MQQVKVKIITKSPRADKFVRGVITRLDAKKHQVSLETQQLSSVGMMPDPNYEVIDVSKMSIAQAIRVYQTAKEHTGKSSKYVLLKDEMHETPEQRIDREALEKSLTDLGLQVITSEADLAHDINTQYHNLSISVSGEEQNV